MPATGQSAPLVWYITAHGFGHAARSCDILSAFHSLHPEIPLRVVTAVPHWFLEERLPPGTTVEVRSLDVGMVQRDPLRVDRSATRERLAELAGAWDELVAEERRYLTRIGAGAVVCDIPAIPLAAAKSAGVPSVAVANFTWDWIYEAYSDGSPAWREAIARFHEAYAATGLLLRLPFAPPMEHFLRRIDIPLVASPGRNRRDQLDAMLGLPGDARLVLLAFSTVPLEREALNVMTSDPDIRYLVAEPAPVAHPRLRAIPRRAMRFADLVASVDAVVSKAGFGIVSDCIVNRKPLVAVRRADFPESAYLEAQAPQFIPCAFIDEEDFFRGRIAPAVREVTAAVPPSRPAEVGGAALAAEWIRKEWYPGGAPHPGVDL